MGAVYLAQDTELDRQVALKVPHITPDDGSRVLERFYREARAAATLRHPNICPVFDIGEIEGVPYLTMAFIEGKALSDYVRTKPLTQGQAATLVRKIALALQEAHQHGIIHRDLKPANIMIDRRGEPIVMDFGLARRTSHGGDTRLTQSGAAIGTPAYMPPEQISANAGTMGPACDIYSLGVILYELITGRLPFNGDAMAMLAQILVDAPPRPSTLQPDIHPALEAICLKAMAKKPEHRYGSMKELANDLLEHLRGKSPPPPAAGGSPTPHPAAVETQPEGIRASMLGGLRSMAQAPQRLDFSKDEPPSRRHKRKLGARRRGMPSWAWAAIGGGGVALIVAVGAIIWSSQRSTPRTNHATDTGSKVVAPRAGDSERKKASEDKPMSDEPSRRPEQGPPDRAAPLAPSEVAGEPKVHRDLPYTDTKNERQMLDIYAPAAGKNLPVVVWIHGGGWQRGNKSEVEKKPQAFVDKGFVFVSINYRLLPDVTIKQMAGDVAKAIHWVRDHAKDYGGDPDRLVVMGHSAGALLAALVCTDDRYLKTEGLSLSSIKACVPVDGDTYDVAMQIKTVAERVAAIYRSKFGDERLQRELSSVTHVARGKNIPPFLILHVADHPETKPQSERLVKALQDAGITAKAYPAEGKNHITLNDHLGLDGDKPTQEMFAFLNAVLKKPEAASSTPRAQPAPPELFALHELNTPRWDFAPWMSPDGLTIYWEAAEGGTRWIWTATRKNLNSTFENKTRLLAGRHPTVTADSLQVIFIDPASGTEQQHRLYMATRSSRGQPFGPAREIEELRPATATERRYMPALSPDGLTLCFMSADQGMDDFWYTTRSSLTSAWNPPQRLGMDLGRLPDRKISWPFLTADRRTLYCGHEGDVGRGRFMVWTRTSTAAPFADFRYLEIPNIPDLYGRPVRYVEATNELFFSSPRPRPISDADWDLWLIRNFGPKNP
jgi:serine/threonine protein kinase/dienelactone hydrolase